MWPGSDLLITKAGGEKNGKNRGQEGGEVHEKLNMLTLCCLCCIVGLGQLGDRHMVGNDQFQGHSMCMLYTIVKPYWRCVLGCYPAGISSPPLVPLASQSFPPLHHLGYHSIAMHPCPPEPL